MPVQETYQGQRVQIKKHSSSIHDSGHSDVGSQVGTLRNRCSELLTRTLVFVLCDMVHADGEILLLMW